MATFLERLPPKIYALNGLFCIDDTKDPDVTNKHGKEETPPLDVAGMVLDIMSSANLDEIKEKFIEKTQTKKTIILKKIIIHFL